MRRHHYDIIRSDMHLPVHSARHSGQCRHGLTLGTGCDKHGLLVRVVFQILNINQSAFRNMDILEFGGNRNNIDHGSAFDNHFSLVLYRRIDNLLHTVNIGRKGRHNDSTVLMLGKNQIKGSSHGALRHRKSRLLRIGGVGHHSQYAILPELCKALQINLVSENRSIIDFEVSRMNQNACRGRNRKGGGILNRVVRLHKFHFQIAEAYTLSELHRLHLHKLIQPVFHEFLLNERQGQLSGINRHIDLL